MRPAGIEPAFGSSNARLGPEAHQGEELLASRGLASRPRSAGGLTMRGATAKKARLGLAEPLFAPASPQAAPPARRGRPRSARAFARSTVRRPDSEGPRKREGCHYLVAGSRSAAWEDRRHLLLFRLPPGFRRSWRGEIEAARRELARGLRGGAARSDNRRAVRAGERSRRAAPPGSNDQGRAARRGAARSSA